MVICKCRMEEILSNKLPLSCLLTQILMRILATWLLCLHRIHLMSSGILSFICAVVILSVWMVCLILIASIYLTQIVPLRVLMLAWNMRWQWLQLNWAYRLLMLQKQSQKVIISDSHAQWAAFTTKLWFWWCSSHVWFNLIAQIPVIVLLLETLFGYLLHWVQLH